MNDFLVQFSVGLYYEKLRIRFVKIVELCKHHENIGAGMNCFFLLGGGGNRDFLKIFITNLFEFHLYL